MQPSWFKLGVDGPREGHPHTDELRRWIPTSGERKTVIMSRELAHNPNLNTVASTELYLPLLKLLLSGDVEVNPGPFA